MSASQSAPPSVPQGAPLQLLVCSCDGTMDVDGKALAAAVGAELAGSATLLCEDELALADQAFAGDGSTIIACGQQAALFEALAEETGAQDRLACVDIRDRAGWSKGKGKGVKANRNAKQAALLADALLPKETAPIRDVTSGGVCLIIGSAETALAAANRVADQLAVTCLITGGKSDDLDMLVPDPRFDIAVGRLKSATGAFAGFEIVVDGFAPMSGAGRQGSSRGGFPKGKDGARSHCDIIVDLTGEQALFPSPDKREGYLRADPGNPAAVERALFDATQMVGTFEKPLYVRANPDLCAHNRSNQPGCTRCVDLCPTGAITPGGAKNGEAVYIDPMVCAGCGACTAACPTTAITYDEPPVSFLFRRIQGLHDAYVEAGGKAPRLLIHDTEEGAEMIRLAARFGDGLPADVIPLDLFSVESVGHAELLAALGVGFREVHVMAGRKTDIAPIESQLELANALLIDPQSRLHLLQAENPDALSSTLSESSAPAPLKETILAMGARREVTRVAASALSPAAEVIELPAGAPYGAIEIDTDGCTLCLACSSLCPAGAISNAEDRPMLAFNEAACLQCGICKNLCPENAITLKPQLNLAKEALSPRVLNEEEPFACIECGKEFGVKSTVERIVAKLKDQHWMYTNSDNTSLIQMCDDCRVQAQYHDKNNPFFAGERKRTVTTQDYIDGKVGEDD